MTSTADVIVLSSSPIPPQSPGPGKHGANQVSPNSPRGATPPPAPSTSDLSKPPTRSRFFPTANEGVKCTKDTTKPKKRVTKKGSTPSSDQTAPSKPRRKTKKDTEAQGTTTPGEPLPGSVGSQNETVKPVKARARKNAKKGDLGNMTLAGKVTKTSGDPPAKKSTKSGKKMPVTKQSSSEDLPDQSTSNESNVLAKDEVLHLDGAMRRRMDWTPPRDTFCEEIAPVNDSGSQGAPSDSNMVAGFGKILSDFNYSGSTVKPRGLVPNANDGGPTKRRRIELVNPEIQALLNGRHTDSSGQASGQEGSKESSLKPKKATKGKPKKFTTLTARMTAQYTNDNAEEESEVECISDIRSSKSRRKGKEAEKESSFTVLSPEAAVEFLNDQDLVFGTCSQLEREDSPQTLREIQQAIRASESLTHPQKSHKDLMLAQEPSNRSVSRMVGNRNMWCVGARDSEGSLIQSKTLGVVDLTDESETAALNEHKTKPASHKPLQKNWFELEFADIDSPPEKRPSLLPLTKEGLGPDTLTPAPAPEVAVTAKNMVVDSAKETDIITPEAAGSQPTTSQDPSMPHYTGFTDTELSKQLSTYGFKAVRGRKKMIDLLQKCWESKHGTDAASHSQPTHPAKQQSQSVCDRPSDLQSISGLKAKAKPTPKTSNKKGKSLDATKSSFTSQLNPQATPKQSSKEKLIKGASLSLIDIEEIQDSEEEIIPSPSQVQKHYTDIYSKTTAGSQIKQPSLDILTKSPPPSPTKRKVVPSKTSKRPAKRPLPSASTTTTSTVGSKQISLAEISPQITQAVRVQPRLSSLSSRDSRTRPTWYEKILMYDPIVLEDFTAWLNIEGLGLVGEDREVGTGTVREWCESKGICCCWKKNASW